jgi:TctA family transporter
MVISRSSLSIFVDRPLSLLHLIFALALIGVMLAFWLMR